MGKANKKVKITSVVHDIIQNLMRFPLHLFILEEHLHKRSQFSPSIVMVPKMGLKSSDSTASTFGR